MTRERADDPAAKRLAERLGEVLPRLKWGIGRAVRRVLKNDPDSVRKPGRLAR